MHHSQITLKASGRTGLVSGLRTAFSLSNSLAGFSQSDLGTAGRVILIATTLLLAAFGLARYTVPPILILSFLSAAATLFIVAGAMAVRTILRRRTFARTEEAVIPKILNALPFAAILTDRTLNPISMNDMARDHFGLPQRSRIATRDELPTWLCDGLSLAAAGLSSASVGTIVGRTSSDAGEEWTIRCRSYSEDRILWQVDPPALAQELPVGRALPLLRITSSGAVVTANDHAITLFGLVPDTVDEVFQAPLPPAGDVAIARTGAGEVPVLVMDLPVDGTDRLVSLVPISPDGQALQQVQTSDWDRFDNLPVPLLWLTPDGHLQKANRSAMTLIGPQCQPGTYLGDLTEGLGRPISDWLDETIAGHRTNSPEFLRVTTSEAETFVQIMLKPITEGGETSLLAVLSDATELKSLEAQFVQSQKMQAIGQLAGGVAHDFNNLLTAISGHCDLLLLRHDQGDPDYADLMQINQNANRAAALVSQLLAFSRKQTLRPEDVDLRETVSDLTHLLNRLVGEKIALSFSHDPVLQSIRADKRQLEQVLMNLVVNARDAIPGSGEIRIVTEGVSFDAPFSRDRVTIPPGDYVSVKVIDTGTGIPPERISKVFEPFYTTKRIGEGTGLGLSTAYGIIKQTGGYIFVDSTLGEGTCFTLLFRANKDEQKVMKEIRDIARTSVRHADGVVLLVEDEAPVRSFASRALRLRGYTVLEAESGEQALDILSDSGTKVDIFVSDVVMPGMDGPTWVRKALEERPDVRVIFVSGYAEENFGDGQSRIPNSVFLPKPFSLSELTQTVQALGVDEMLS